MQRREPEWKHFFPKRPHRKTVCDITNLKALRYFNRWAVGLGEYSLEIAHIAKCF